MEKTDYRGIDYSCGTANRDMETGIRFGVINQNDVGQAWYDASEPYYGEPCCPKCGNDADLSDLLAEDEIKDWEREPHEGEDFGCYSCEYIFGMESAFPESALSFGFDEEGYKAECGANYGDIFVMKSPYFTYAQFCSPCAPGACHLMNPLKEPNMSNKCYCFGSDWFMDEKAPYPVYSVATGELVE